MTLDESRWRVDARSGGWTASSAEATSRHRARRRRTLPQNRHAEGLLTDRCVPTVEPIVAGARPQAGQSTDLVLPLMGQFMISP